MDESEESPSVYPRRVIGRLKTVASVRYIAGERRSRVIGPQKRLLYKKDCRLVIGDQRSNSLIPGALIVAAVPTSTIPGDDA